MKYYTIVVIIILRTDTYRKKKAELRKTEGHIFTSRAVDHNKEKPVMEGIEGAVTSDPGGSSGSTLFVIYQLFEIILCSFHSSPMCGSEG